VDGFQVECTPYSEFGRDPVCGLLAIKDESTIAKIDPARQINAGRSTKHDWDRDVSLRQATFESLDP